MTSHEILWSRLELQKLEQFSDLFDSFRKSAKQDNFFFWFQINDRYEFPLQLDLDRENGRYLSPDADKSVRNLYALHR